MGLKRLSSHRDGATADADPQTLGARPLLMTSVPGTCAESSVWVSVFGDADEEKVEGLAADPSDNFYLAGHFSGGIDFGQGNMDAFGADGFVSSFTSGGCPRWTRRVGDIGNDRILAVTASDTQVAVVGYFARWIDIGAGAVS